MIALPESDFPGGRCPDCGILTGDRHLTGCDVARCTHCGQQHLGCDDPAATPNIWTGEWPGEAEVREGLATDLNDLAVKGFSGKLRWDGQRWQRPIASHEVFVNTPGLYRATVDAWYAVEKELDVEWTARQPIQGEATYKVFAYRIGIATIEALVADGWRPPND